MKFEKLSELTEPIAERLRVALGPDTLILREQVKQNAAELWECDGGDAYMITRVDQDELVVCCYEGSKVKQALPHLIASAKAKGFIGIRFHTKRQALARLLKDYKPELSEYIYRIPVSEN